ncbi:MAG: helix-turn-helix domain-containing protein [Chitinophagales bacterium]|nr:helix-turn-helix domain-containing protein [Chitinophagales bacterium]
MIPTHTIPNENTTTTVPFFMLVNWSGARKIVHTPHRHAFNELIFIVKEGGEHEIDFIDYPIQKQTVHFVRTAQVHQIKRTDEAAGYSILFSNDFLLQTPIGNLILQGLNELMPLTQPILWLNDTDFVTVCQLLAQIENEYQQRAHKQQSDTIVAYLHLLFTLLQRNKTITTTPTPTAPFHQTLQQFHALIEQHYAQQWTVSQYAAALFITPNYLNELSQRETQQTAHWHIQNRILVEAKRQLCYSNLPIKIIADQLGFDDTAYFARFFKKHCHVSPSEYRTAAQIR